MGRFGSMSGHNLSPAGGRGANGDMARTISHLQGQQIFQMPYASSTPGTNVAVGVTVSTESGLYGHVGARVEGSIPTNGAPSKEDVIFLLGVKRDL